jgi:hypothetical protein
MILAEKSGAMPRPTGILEFIFNLLSHHHAEGFRKSQRSVPKANWGPASPGYL